MLFMFGRLRRHPENPWIPSFLFEAEEEAIHVRSSIAQGASVTQGLASYSFSLRRKISSICATVI